ncbi:MAG: hypothetical protein MJE77_29335 [Proteobacteria bacterium]|nr:hypothetical protein [Pseudomonadota bacterium]
MSERRLAGLSGYPRPNPGQSSGWIILARLRQRSSIVTMDELRERERAVIASALVEAFVLCGSKRKDTL